jgi:ketosteroid isomerase-like protein
VATLVRNRVDAALAGDTARWHRQVADQCLFTGPTLSAVSTSEMLPMIAANRTIRPASQQIEDLVVHLTGDVAQATYVERVQDSTRSPAAARRLRETDTYVRRGPDWIMIGAAEIDAPNGARLSSDSTRAAPVAGRH